MTKSKFNRIVSVILVFVLLLGTANWNTFTAKAEDGYSNTLNEWIVNSWWTMSDGSSNTLDKTDSLSNSDTVEVKLNLSYAVKKAQKDYLPGEFSFSFKGIGDVKRGGMIIGSTVGIDDNGNSTNTDKNWDVSYDAETDTYTFVNKITISKDTSQQGGFDIVWHFPSRDGINGYQTEIDPVFTLKDVDDVEQIVNMPPMTYQYNSEEDDFKLTVNLYPENDGRVDGTFYETADKAFVWYQYRTQLWQGNEDVTNYADWKARGLYKSDLFMEIDVEDILKDAGVDMDSPDFNINDYVRVVNSSGGSVSVVKTNIDGEDRWGYYITKDKYGDYNHHNDYYYKIAYNQEVFNGKEVEVKAILNRLYNDEDEYQLLRDSEDNYYADKENVDVTAYKLGYGGYSFYQRKYNSHENSDHAAPDENKKLVVDNIYNGSIVAYTLESNASKIYTASASRTVRRSAPVSSDTGLTENSVYSLVIGDDELEVYLNSGKKRILTTDEYHFSYLRMPNDGKNHNYTIFVSDKQDPEWDDYTPIVTGNTNTAQYVALGENVKAFYVKIDGVTGSYSYTPTVGVSLHLDYEAEMEKSESDQVNSSGHIVNYSFMRMLYNNNETEMDYCGRTSAALDNLNKDNEPDDYGCYLTRSSSNLWLRVPKVTLSSKTHWEAKQNPGSSKIGYTVNVDTYGTIMNTDGISGDLKQFAVYSILPSEFNVTQQTIADSFTLQASGTDRSGFSLTSEDFENHIKKQELVTLDDGRTALCVTFDFSDRPIEISTTTSIHINYSANISGKVLDMSNHNFTVESRTAILDNGFVVMAKPANGYDTNKQLVKDTDNLSGDTSRDMAGSYYKGYLSSVPSAWNNASEKQVKVGNDIDYSKDRETYYGDEEVVSAYNPDNPSDDMIYTYEIGITVRNIKTNDLVIYDNIETYEITEGGIISSWHGIPLELDTTKLENKNFVPHVYYSENEAQQRDLTSDGWTLITEYNNGKWTIPSNARSIAIKLGTENMSDGQYEASQEVSDELYAYLKMRSPVPTRNIIDKKAYNTCSAKYLQEGDSVYTEISGTYTSVTLSTKFYIEKVDASDNDTKLSDATFEIYESDKTTLVDTVTTNRFGRAEVQGLIFGETYYYKEINPPKGYQRNCEGTFTVSKSNQIFVIENKHLQGAVKLTKYDEDNPDIKIKAGAEYQLFSSDGTQIYTDDSYTVSENGTVDTFVTDDNSTITITGLSWGVYYFVETKAPQGYELDSDSKIYFTIDKSLDSGEVDLDTLWANCAHGDKEKTASLLLKKTDKTDGKPLQFAYYQLQRLDSDGNWQTIPTSYSTNTVGEIKVDGIGFGTYRFKEYNPPAGYKLKDESELTESDEITINADTFSDDSEVVLKTAQTNERKTGSVMLNKVDKDTESALSGAVFALYKVEADGNKFIKGGFTTDSYGRLVADTSKDESDLERFKIQGLEWGDYYFLETKSPKGYEKPTEDYCKENFKFTVDASNVDSTPTVTADNTQVKGSVKLTKVSESDKDKMLEGAEFELLQNGNAVNVKRVTMGDTGFYYYDNSSDDDEIKSFVKKTFDYEGELVIGDVTSTLITNANGLIEVYNLPWGTYEFHETKAPNGYSKADNIRFVVNSSNCLFQQELECADPDLTCEITIDKVIDDCIEAYGDSTFMFKVKQIKDINGNVDPDMEWTVYITLPYPEKFGSVTLNVPAGEYEITEMPVSRYKPVKIETVKSGTTTSKYTPEPSSTSDFKATCILGTDNDGNPQKFEVEYTNKLTRYDQFSHVTCAENYIAKQKQITGLSLDYPEMIPVDPNSDENTVYILDKSKLTGSFIYDDGSIEPLTPEQIADIMSIDSEDGEFKINNSIESQGQDFMLRAKYTDPDTSRIFNTAFVVTVDAFDPAAYRKITFTTDVSVGGYIGTVGTTANVVFYDENNEAVLGKYIEAKSSVGMKFIGWTSADDPNNLLSGDIDYYSLPEGTVLSANYILEAFEYEYKNSAQTFSAPVNGYYEIELWGASGGPSNVKAGRGGYTKGTVYLTTGTELYVYTGGASTNTNTAGGFNGGGAGKSDGYGGGGATDIRLVGGSWNNFDSLKSRIMVAGGGGGANTYSGGSYGGYAGGLVGDYGHIRSDKNNPESEGYFSAYGGTQVGGGKAIQLPSGRSPGGAGALGKGGNANSYGGGGGAGYYGGAGGCNRPCGDNANTAIHGKQCGNSEAAGAGGSSFISGYEGCDAIAESSISSKIVHTGQPNHYSGYVFRNSEMIDGNSEMPSTSGDTEIGHSGNGYARITFVGTKLN